MVIALGAAAVALMPIDVKEFLHTKGELHPWMHMAVFAWLAIAALLAPRRWPLRLLLLAAAVAFGAGMEWTEGLYFHQPVEFADIRTDTLGVLIGGLAGTSTLALARSRRRKPSTRKY